jgi:hypothetical protein
MARVGMARGWAAGWGGLRGAVTASVVVRLQGQHKVCDLRPLRPVVVTQGCRGAVDC